MFPKINPTSTQSWKLLQEHYNVVKKNRIENYFKEDHNRFESYSITSGDILFDYSKNNIINTTKSLLISLASECQLEAAIEAMFSGEKINETEGRAVLHTALRNFSDESILVDGKNIIPDIKKVLEQMKSFCIKIHDGSWKGFSGKKIK